MEHKRISWNEDVPGEVGGERKLEEKEWEMERKLWLGAQRSARREEGKGLEEGQDNKIAGEMKEG